MIRIFDDQYPINYKSELRKMALIMGIILLMTIGVSALIIVYRHILGSLLAQLLGIAFSSIGFIAIFIIVFELVIPASMKANLIARLTSNEHRSITGKVISISSRPEFHLMQPFNKLKIETGEGILEVYLWWPTKAPYPQIEATIKASLAENVIMGYETL
ncbi:MAG TPA: hypothetical protein PK340_02170 [Bacilli bacterium]|nr:hypothetical protein [Bacilli bacterium]